MMSAMRFRSVGAHAVLLEVEDPPVWFAEVWRRRAAGELEVTDIVPGARTLLLDGIVDVATTVERLRSWPQPDPATLPRSDRVDLPVSFADGADLGDVAQLWQTDEQGVIDRLTTIEFVVAFCGFAPGFAYLTGLPEEWAVPRLATPRSRVPAGSVALADRYAGVYPNSSPGGWRLVGRTSATLFNPERTPPALLTPGTPVRFVPVAADA
jgi:KipI family sensor histidine kinase inhibitor